MMKIMPAEMKAGRMKTAFAEKIQAEIQPSDHLFFIYLFMLFL